ncbi:MAG: hypothetical protein PHD29_01580 [bacterium]|nr:hypothetical protein [bacterium]MDD5757284.1 hypothetical protein [bacterium]
MIKENEIVSLRAGLSVIKKRRGLIAGVLISFCVLGYIVAQLMPNYATMTMVLDFGGTEIVPSKTIEKIKRNFYHDKILSKLKQNSAKKALNISAALLPDLPVARISARSLAQDSNLGKEYLRQLYYALQEENTAAIEIAKEGLKKKQERALSKIKRNKGREERKIRHEIKMMELNIKETETQINQLEERTKDLEERKTELRSEYDEAQKEYEEIKVQNKKKTALGTPNYLNLTLNIQNKYILYKKQIQELDDDKYVLLSTIQEKKNKIDRQKIEISFLSSVIQENNLEPELEEIDEDKYKEIMIVQETASSPTKKDQDKTVIAIFVVLGVLAGLLVPFALEYFRSKGKSV